MYNLFYLFVKNFDFYINLLFKHIYISYMVVSISAILGIILGIIVEKCKWLSKPIIQIINLLYTIPSIAMFGFLIPIVGIGDKNAIIALIIYALLPIVLNTYTGLKNIDKDIISTAIAMGTTRFQLLFRIKLPLAFPIILSSIRNSLIMTIALTGIASFIGAGGLGVAIYRGITTNNIELTILGSFLIAILAIISDFILHYINKIYIKKHGKIKKHFYFLIFIIISIFSLNYYIENSKTESINIATKPMTEQYILGEMLKLVIEKNLKVKVNLINGISGGTNNIHLGMLNKNFDIYPEYTSTSFNQVLKEKKVYKDEDFEYMNNEYIKKYNMKYVSIIGFNNTYGLAIRKEDAKKYNIKTYDDLKIHSNKFILGAEYDFFERLDGYESLKKRYNFNFKKTVDMDISLKYKSLKDKKVDAIIVFTTDAMINDNEIVVLKDNLNYFNQYKAGIITRLEILEKYKNLENILKIFDNLISDSEMAKLNYEVEVESKEPYEVAKNYLVKKGVFHE